MVGSALALRLDQHAHVFQFIVRDWRERLEQLQSLTVFGNSYLDSSLGGSHIPGILHGKSGLGKFYAFRRVQFDRFPFAVYQRSFLRIEGQVARNGKGRNNLGRGYKSVCIRISIVARCEFPVERKS
jgi:hypothetical protein